MIDRPSPQANNVLIESLSSALSRGEQSLGVVPDLLKRILAEDAWREFDTRRGEHVTHERFAEFVTTAPLKGLGSDIDLVRRIVAADDMATELLGEALKEKPGPKSSHDNNTRSRQGDSKAYALRRLHKDAPELHSEVLSGNLSAHAAMVQAGFRQKTISVPVSKPERVAAYLRKHMPREAISRLVVLLIQDDGEPPPEPAES